jgi:SAM-dependent methyltransferase
MEDVTITEHLASAADSKDQGSRRHRLRLLGLSFLMLFLELALIRWLGANVLYLSFFSNLVLLGSFLGIGIGFLAADRPRTWIKALPWALLLMVGFVFLFPIEISRSTSDVLFFGDPQPSGLPIWLTVPALFIFVVAIMAMVGQEVARAFSLLSPLVAYGWDIGGSLLGIVGFTVVSYLRAPPIVWAAIVAVLLLLLVGSWRGADRLALAGVVLILGIQSFTPGLSWSPYYQISVYELDGRPNIAVNGIPHQAIAPVQFLTGTIYSQPYSMLAHPNPDNVLIVGAGNGNDVAVALANGAGHVDAIEIDPALYELGVELHPDRPYADPRVTVTIDDGRAFMQRSKSSYDLIIFALPDSLTLLSGQSSLRLESYLFTVDALQRAHELLAPDGTFVMYNFYREEWLIERLAGTLEEAFGQRPCVVSVGDESRLALLAVGPETSDACAGDRVDTAGAPLPVTDDYPFLYVRERGVPGFYLLTLGLILAASLVAVRASVGQLKRLRPYADLFAMGAAFLLLETKSVVQFALWFGTTWIVNSLVFAGVLISVLGAIAVARRFRLPHANLLYGALFATLAIAWAVPTDSLLSLSPSIRWVAATVLTFTPIFVANLIFAQRFAQTASATAAFGANLLGAMLGGVLEYSALVVGYRALIVGAGLIYLVALVLKPVNGLNAPAQGS